MKCLEKELLSGEKKWTTMANSQHRNNGQYFNCETHRYLLVRHDDVMIVISQFRQLVERITIGYHQVILRYIVISRPVGAYP